MHRGQPHDNASTALMPTIAENIAALPAEARCGAKTRTGSPCKNPSVRGHRRCRMHGGRSLSGVFSPRLKHGLYSRDPLAQPFHGASRLPESVKRLLISEGEITQSRATWAHFDYRMRNEAAYRRRIERTIHEFEQGIDRVTT
ncbi:MAG: HGGxSTG domain-containing protein [Bacteroidota bacterium]